ncbi:hypothetical protein T484DRAFT_1852777, partial [Baffinella frigidus]
MSYRVDPGWLLEPCKDSFVCGICQMLIDEMCIGCTEGHGYCRHCYYQWMSDSAHRSCPTCKRVTTMGQLVRNRPFDELSAELLTRCKHGDHAVVASEEGAGASSGQPGASDALHRAVKVRKIGATAGEFAGAQAAPPRGICAWTGPVGAFSGHLDSECEFQMHTCKNRHCPVSLHLQPMKEHVKLCPWRPTECTHCSAVYPLADMESHRWACTRFPIPCINAGSGELGGFCKENVPREDMDAHLEICEWQSMLCPCEGCGARFMRIKKEEHDSMFAAKHD